MVCTYYVSDVNERFYFCNCSLPAHLLFLHSYERKKETAHCSSMCSSLRSEVSLFEILSHDYKLNQLSFSMHMWGWGEDLSSWIVCVLSGVLGLKNDECLMSPH